MSATLQVKLNGGAPQTGGIYPNLNDTVQLSAADRTGWGNPPTRWEIYDYPKGFSAPSGWLTDTDGSYYVLGSADPPSFQVTVWGYYGTRLSALGGASATSGVGVTDESTVLRVLSPSGLKDPGRREDAQFGSVIRRSVESFKDNLRVIESAVATAASAPGPNLTDASVTILYSQGARRILPANTLTANRVITIGTSDSPPTGAVIAVVINNQGSSGYQVVFSPGLGTNTGAESGTYFFRYNGSAWTVYGLPGAYGIANANAAGLLSATNYQYLANLIATPTVSYSSGSPTLTPASFAVETLFYLSGTVTVPKLPAASTWLGQRIVVKCENIGAPCVVTADTGAPDLMDGAATQTVAPPLYGTQMYVAKASAVVRCFPGNT